MKLRLVYALVVGLLLLHTVPATAQTDIAAQDKVAEDVEKAIAELNAAFVQLARWCESALMWKHAETTYDAALRCEAPNQRELDLARDRAEQNHKKVDTNPAVSQYAVCAKKAETLRVNYSRRLAELAKKASALGMAGVADRASGVAAKLDPPVGTGDPEFCEKLKALVQQRAGAYYGVAASCEADKMWGEAESVLDYVIAQCPQRWEVEAEIEIAKKRKELVNSRPSKEQIATFSRQMDGLRAGFRKKFAALTKWAESKGLSAEADQARQEEDDNP